MFYYFRCLKSSTHGSVNDSDDEIIGEPRGQERHQNQNQELRVTHDLGTRSGLDTSRSASFRDVSRRSSRCKLGDWDFGVVTMGHTSGPGSGFLASEKRERSPSGDAFVAWDYTRGLEGKKKEG